MGKIYQKKQVNCFKLLRGASTYDTEKTKVKKDIKVR